MSDSEHGCTCDRSTLELVRLEVSKADLHNSKSMTILDLYRQSNCTIPTESDLTFAFSILPSHAKQIAEHLRKHFDSELVSVSIQNETFRDVYSVKSKDSDKRIDVEFVNASSESIISEAKYRPRSPQIIEILCKVWSSDMKLEESFKIG